MDKDLGQEHIEAAYDADPEREWQRLDRHRTELAVTLRAMADHLPTPPSWARGRPTSSWTRWALAARAT